MAPDDEADDDVGAGGPPLPPDDRLWRHPSELREHGSSVGIGSRWPRTRRRPALWTVAVVAGLAGATLSAGVMVIAGTLSTEVVERPIVEKVALAPVVSSPMVSSARGVADLAERLSPAVVRLDVERPDGTATGSGVLFRDDGLVLASAHVVADATAILVHLADGRRLDGRLVGVDAVTAVALIDLEGEGFPVAVVGSAAGLRVGAPTVAIGSPAESDGGPSVSSGTISALDRRVDGPGGQPLHGMIEIDAAIRPSASGGALVDENGALIGIMTAVASQLGEHSAFATPIDLAHRVANELLATGRMRHCWLGVEGADVSAQQADLLHIDGGAVVQRVAASSPAEQAGLNPADVITELDRTSITSISKLVAQLRMHAPGDKVVIGYWRGGRHASARVTLVERL